MIDKLIYGAIGFVIGGLIGGGVVGHMVTDELKNRIDSLESKNDKLTKELYELKSEKLKKKDIEVVKEKVKKVEKVEEIKDVEEDDNDLDVDWINEYESIRKRYVSSNDNDDNDEDDQDHAAQIKRIDEETYMNDLQYRDNEQLIYYQEDGTLVDSMNDIVTNEADIVGYEVMDMIEDTDDDFVYALDDLENKMYEISVEHNLSYTRDVLGIGG